MDDKIRKLRQLDAIKRLRIMKRYQAEVSHAQAQVMLSNAVRAFEDDVSRYIKSADARLYAFSPENAVNPELSQQRLSSLVDARARVKRSFLKLETEKANVRALKCDLVKRNISVEVISKAESRLRTHAIREDHKEQQIDISDAGLNSRRNQ